VKKKIFSIWSVLLILIVSIAVVVPGCGDGACTGDIEVKATLCDEVWEGDVEYKLTGPGAAAPTIINGTNVTTTHSGVECGDWTCEYVSGGPPGAYFVNITPDPTQEVTSNSTKTFIINFEEYQDAGIECSGWTVDGMPIGIPGEPVYEEVVECQIVDVHFIQWVLGCEGYEVAVNETSWLTITQTGGPEGPPALIFVYNDLCAVNKTPQYGDPPKKVSQNTTLFGEFVNPGGEPIPLFPQEPVVLDVETIWTLVKEVDYLKSINWLGISMFEPMPHPCVLFELVVPGPGAYTFTLVASAEVELMDDVDVNTQNNNAICPPLTLTVLAGI